MDKQKSGKIAIIFVGLIFIIVGIFIFFPFLSYKENKEILKNGTETLATVKSFDSNVEINEVKYYFIKYEYSDELGTIYNGKTSSKYTIGEAQTISLHGEIAIKFIGDKSIESDFVLKDILLETCLGIGLMVLGLLVVVIGIVFLIKKKTMSFGEVTDVQSQNQLPINEAELINNIMQNGTEKTGTFLTTMPSNLPDRSYVTFSYINQAGNKTENTSLNNFSAEEINQLSAKNNFKIKYINEDEIIISENFKQNDEIIQQQEQQEQQKVEQTIQTNTANNSYKFCPNCGAPLSASDSFCPNCGTNLKQQNN